MGKGWHHLFFEVEEVVGLVDEEELERRATQVVAAQVDLAQVGQRAFEVVADAWQDGGGHRAPQVSPSIWSPILGPGMGSASPWGWEEPVPKTTSTQLLGEMGWVGGSSPHLAAGTP